MHSFYRAKLVVILDREGAWISQRDRLSAKLLLKAPTPEGTGYVVVADEDALAPQVNLTDTREHNRIASNMEALDFGFLERPTPATHVGLFDKRDQLIGYGLLERPHGDLLGSVTIGVGNLQVRLSRAAYV